MMLPASDACLAIFTASCWALVAASSCSYSWLPTATFFPARATCIAFWTLYASSAAVPCSVAVAWARMSSVSLPKS
ncbi:Uncharacterised protein [Pseudomonas putida]|nr:Uncharacterised protein [Pseudomonas putida]CAB5706446.1 Uncharacterised protein [Pseudomonas putida]